MKVSPLLLLHIFFIVYPASGYSEYFVKPTQPVNNSCPGQPCLTLTQYIIRTEYYFNSNNNSVFTLLSGIHTISSPVIVTNSSNVTFRSYSENDSIPTVIFNSSSYCVCPKGVGICSSCSAFQFYNTVSAAIRGIEVIAVQYSSNSSIAVISFSNCVAITLQRVSGTISDKDGISELHDCVVRDGLQYLYIICGGVLLQESTNTSILNSTFSYGGIYTTSSSRITFHQLFIENSIRQGISMKYGSEITVGNVSVLNTASHCIRLEGTQHVRVASVSLRKCGDNGVHQVATHNTVLDSIIFSDMSVEAIQVNLSKNTTVTNLVSNSCILTCIHLHLSSHTLFENITLMGSGLLAENVQDTSFVNFNITMYNTGMMLINAIETVIRDSSLNMTPGSPVAALYLTNSSNTSIHKTKFGTSISIKNCQKTILDGIQMENNSSLIMDHCQNTVIRHTSFQQFYNLDTDRADHHSIVFLYRSRDVYFHECNFRHNTISAIKALATNLTLSGSVIFANNTAPIGPGLILQQQSAMTIISNSSVVFSDNHATLVGGAIYVDTNMFYGSSFESVVEYAVCFFNYKGGSIEFYNNSASSGGDIVYGGHIGMAMAANGSNCLHQFKMVSKVSPNNTLSAISCRPLRACVCDSSGQPDCLKVFHSYTIYPGVTIYLSAVVVGQDFGTMVGSVYSQFSDKANTTLKEWQYSQMVKHTHCNQLNYSIFASPKNNTILFLTAYELPLNQPVTNETFQKALQEYENYQGGKGQFPQDLLSFPVQINISVQQCPTGFTLSEFPHKCVCAPHLSQLPGVKCHIQTLSFERSQNSWIGMEDKSLIVSNGCRFFYCIHSALNVSVADLNLQCNFNHSGLLCGSCQNGLSVGLGSENQCFNCSNKYLALMIPFALAGIGFIFAIKILDITVSSGYVNGLALYFNIVHIMWLILLPPNNNKVIAAIIAWTNLDLGIETCFFNGLTIYWKTWLQFIFPLYLWSISAVVIILARFSRRMASMMGSNPVSVLATIFLLSYTKLLRNCVSVMFYSVIVYPHTTKMVWSVDGSIEYLGPKHLPLFLIAVVFLLFFCLPYTLTLLLGQWLIRCDNRTVSRVMFRMKPIMDAYYGPLKDKHRYWVGMLLVSRAIVYVALALVPKPHINSCLLAASILAVFLLQMSGYVMGFYRNWKVSVYEITLISNLAMYTVAKLYIRETKYATLLLIDDLFVGVGIAQLCLLIVILWFAQIKNLIRGIKFLNCLERCVKKNEVDVNNDMETDEEVPLLGDSPNNTNEKQYITINSFPTYGT